MGLKKERFTHLMREFKLRELFNELGWDNVKKKEKVIIDEHGYELEAIAEKRDFLIFICSPDQSGKIPNQNLRRKIDNKIAKLYFEHLIIYHNKDNTQQLWQLVIRESGKPIIIRETPYFSTQTPELLYQKLSGLFISIDDEENITIVDVKSNVHEQFNSNAEKVTKKFYDRFQKELIAFQRFIEGITDNVDKEWYASLMLNRLMFIYFIQKKGFLDNNKNYLSDKLKYSREKKGKNKFYSFYRNFLLVLFHKGLGAPNHSIELEKEIGKVPYLNGGLFEVHQLEENNKKIQIEDKAFEKIFAFFDEYEWHLDNRPTSTGKDINPDVIGYIFEKYINDRAAMGAYYTKEDITEYIGKNTIIPFLFDKVKSDCAIALKEDSSLWKMLRENPDRYIYDAIKHGIYDESGGIRELPDNIQIGINPEIQNRIVKDVEKNPPQLLELRKDWNKPAPEEYALPTEIWREVVERRQRYFDIRGKITSGEINNINDFITYNLNIRQFAQDAVEQYEGSDFVEAFYKAIIQISILDPTCGSGAFLFAALNILEPLYEACLSRMKEFIETDDQTKGKRYQYFRIVIEDVSNHLNEKYFIYKSIILKNLYGVDIMKEATEIAKLRLFLKLVAEVEVNYGKDNLGLEPLPDIDFNIRSGNTLVGFAKAEDVDKSVEGSFDETFLKEEIERIKEEAELVSMAFQRYKNAQLIIEKNDEEHSISKQELKNRLNSLNEKLSLYQARLYGVNPKKKKEYDVWSGSHQPFHWFAEFYEIINSGGFDVIIGNPPYVMLSNNLGYSVENYKTYSCKNLYAYCIERSSVLIKPNGALSMIVPISIIGNKKMIPIKTFITEKYSVWFASFSGDTHPGTLFSGVQQNVSIIIWRKEGDKKIFTSEFIRFTDTNTERDALFTSRISFVEAVSLDSKTLKNSRFIEKMIITKIFTNKSMLLEYDLSEKEPLWYHDVVHYWVKCFAKPPFFKRGKAKPSISSHYKAFKVPQRYKEVIMGIISSSLFYFWYIINSNGRDVSRDDVLLFPFDPTSMSLELIKKIKHDSIQLKNDLEKNRVRVSYEKKNDNVLYDQYWPENSKSYMDPIDIVLAAHYGLTEEELDFIINYDIKYRMGKELEEE